LHGVGKPLGILCQRRKRVLRIPVDRDRAFRFNVTKDSEFA